MLVCSKLHLNDFAYCIVFCCPLLQVYHLPYTLAARYPKTRIGRLATCSDHSRRLDLCDDYVVHSNEFFFDRDPEVFHNIFHFYRYTMKDYKMGLQINMG